MRRYGWILLGIMGCMAQAAQPIYYFPSLIRGSQLLWQHEQAGTPNGAVPFMWAHLVCIPWRWRNSATHLEAYQDSALAFPLAAEHLVARILLLRVGGFIASRSWPSSMGPAFVRQQGEEDQCDSGRFRALGGGEKRPCEAGLAGPFCGAKFHITTASATSLLKDPI